MPDVAAAIRVTKTLLHHLQRQGMSRPDLGWCAEAPAW